MSEVAVLGLGAMGLPMAARLAESGAVRAFEPAEARAAAARAAGIAVAATPAEAVAGIDVAVLAVRTAEQAEACLFGPDGAAGGLAAGTVAVLTSTVGRDAAIALAGRLEQHAIELVDLPVSGGPVRARAGDLVAFAGGRAETLERVRPVVDRLASTLVVVGPRVGDGQAMKTVNQLLCGVHIAAAAEALLLAQRLGLDPAAALEGVSAGAAASFMLGNRGPRIVEALAGDQPEVLSRIDIFVKDLGIVEAAARPLGLELEVAGAAARLFARADGRGQGADDDSTVVRAIGSADGTD
jgi:3-hydroxyisobutyrate dehydrogenase